MDQIYFWIVILFLVIIFLDFCEKRNKKEKFTNINHQPMSDYKIPPYFEENKLKTNTYANTNSSINFNNKNINFKNFTTDSQTPPYLKCSLCKLDFDCVDYPFETDNNHQNVCHKCNNNVCMNNFVYAKSAGKPRVCRSL